jgi:hypothetical protein
MGGFYRSGEATAILHFAAAVATNCSQTQIAVEPLGSPRKTGGKIRFSGRLHIARKIVRYSLAFHANA